MISSHNPSQERRRLRTLKSYDLLDTPAEEDLEQLVWLASYLSDCPIALISLVDENRQWFKARIGLASPETSREISFCRHTLESTKQLLVPNTLKDPRFVDNPLVTSEPHVRFYLGTPLVSPDGMVLGTLCVLDTRPKRVSDDVQHALSVLARQVMAQFELRRTARRLVRRGHNGGDPIKNLAQAVEISRTRDQAVPQCDRCHRLRLLTGEWVRLSELTARLDDPPVEPVLCPKCLRKLSSDPASN